MNKECLVLNGYSIDYMSNNGFAGVAVVNADTPNKAASILLTLGSFSTVGYKIKTITPLYILTHIEPKAYNKVVGEVIASKGDIGPRGPKGEDGKMSFEDLTPEQKASLKGDKGDIGPRGIVGPRGIQGEVGPLGIQGIQGELGILGPKGNQGDSAYQVAVEHGYSGTEEEWLESLKAYGCLVEDDKQVILYKVYTYEDGTYINKGINISNDFVIVGTGATNETTTVLSGLFSVPLGSMLMYTENGTITTIGVSLEGIFAEGSSFKYNNKDVLTEDKLKTINNLSIVGEGNLDINVFTTIYEYISDDYSYTSINANDIYMSNDYGVFNMSNDVIQLATNDSISHPAYSLITLNEDGISLKSNSNTLKLGTELTYNDIALLNDRSLKTINGDSIIGEGDISLSTISNVILNDISIVKNSTAVIPLATAGNDGALSKEDKRKINELLNEKADVIIHGAPLHGGVNINNFSAHNYVTTPIYFSRNDKLSTASFRIRLKYKTEFSTDTQILFSTDYGLTLGIKGNRFVANISEDGNSWKYPSFVTSEPFTIADEYKLSIDCLGPDTVILLTSEKGSQVIEFPELSGFDKYFDLGIVTFGKDDSGRFPFKGTIIFDDYTEIILEDTRWYGHCITNTPLSATPSLVNLDEGGYLKILNIVKNSFNNYSEYTNSRGDSISVISTTSSSSPIVSELRMNYAGVSISTDDDGLTIGTLFDTNQNTIVLNSWEMNDSGNKSTSLIINKDWVTINDSPIITESILNPIIRYNTNRAKLDSEYALTVAASRNIAIRLIKSGNTVTSLIGLNFEAISNVSLSMGDEIRILSSGNFIEYAMIEGSDDYTKAIGALDRLFSNQVSVFKPLYNALVSHITRIDFLDLSMANSICSMFEKIKLTSISKILPTMSCNGATELFYGDNESLSTNKILVHFAGMDCSALPYFYNKRPGYTGNFHPLAGMFGKAELFNDENNYCSLLRNLPIFRNLKHSLDPVFDGNTLNRTGFAVQSHIFLREGSEEYIENELIDKLIIDFIDSLGEGTFFLYPFLDTNGNSIGDKAYITFSIPVYNKIRERMLANPEVRAAIKYAMDNKNWVFTYGKSNKYGYYLHP